MLIWPEAIADRAFAIDEEIVERRDIVVDQSPLIGGEFGLDLGLDHQIVDDHRAPLRASIAARTSFKKGMSANWSGRIFSQATPSGCR